MGAVYLYLSAGGRNDSGGGTEGLELLLLRNRERESCCSCLLLLQVLLRLYNHRMLSLLRCPRHPLSQAEHLLQQVRLHVMHAAPCMHACMCRKHSRVSPPRGADGFLSGELVAGHPCIGCCLNSCMPFGAFSVCRLRPGGCTSANPAGA